MSVWIDLEVELSLFSLSSLFGSRSVEFFEGGDGGSFGWGGDESGEIFL